MLALRPGRGGLVSRGPRAETSFVHSPRLAVFARSSSGRGEEPRGRWAHCSTVLAATAQSRRPSSDPSASGTREDASHGAAGGGGPGQDPGRKRRPGEKSADYYANVGDAVRTLREDLPMMFMREPNFNIYRRDHGLRCAVRPAHVG